MLGDQKRITTINNLKTINTNIRNIQIYLISKRKSRGRPGGRGVGRGGL